MAAFLHNLQGALHAKTGQAQPAGATQAGATQAGATPQVVSDFVAAMNAGDLNRIMGCFSDGPVNVLWGGVARPGTPFGTWSSKSSLQTSWDMCLAGLATHSTTLGDVWTMGPDGKRLVACATCNGSVKSTGQAWSNVQELWQIELDASNKFSTFRAFTDTLAIASAYGIPAGIQQQPTGVAATQGQYGQQAGNQTYQQQQQQPSSSQYGQTGTPSQYGGSSQFGQNVPSQQTSQQNAPMGSTYAQPQGQGQGQAPGLRGQFGMGQ